MPIEPIKIQGLAEFSRNIRTMDAGLAKGIRVALNGAAGIVVGVAKPRVPKRSGRAASTLKARSTRDSVRVVEGGPRALYMPWLDFGGRVGKNHSVKRAFLKQGRYVFAAYADHKDDIRAEIEKALIDIARQAGIEVD